MGRLLAAPPFRWLSTASSLWPVHRRHLLLLATDGIFIMSRLSAAHLVSATNGFIIMACLLAAPLFVGHRRLLLMSRPSTVLLFTSLQRTLHNWSPIGGSFLEPGSTLLKHATVSSQFCCMSMNAFMVSYSKDSKQCITFFGYLNCFTFEWPHRCRISVNF